MTNPHANSELATAIHRAADLLVEREIGNEDRIAALTGVRLAIAALENGTHRSEDDRLAAFMSEMLAEAAPGQPFAAFAASPYSGAANALRPTSVEYRAIDDGVHATVTMGIALEGKPGRAHGGATAAVFDDVMGAVQRIIRRSGYTRKLTIDYLAPLPVESPVEFVVTYSDGESGRFTLTGTATHDGKMVASAVGVFTEVSVEKLSKTGSATTNVAGDASEQGS